MTNAEGPQVVAGQGDSRLSTPTSQHEGRRLHLCISSGLTQPGPFARYGGGAVHLADLDGFFSHRCCQASSPNGLMLLLGFYLLH